MKKLTLLFIVLMHLSPIFSTDYLKSSSDTVAVYFEKLDEGGYTFYADNKHFIPQFVSLGFTKLSNLSMDRANPSQVVLPPNSEKVLIATLTVIKQGSSYSFNSRLSSTAGDPITVKPDDFIYIFPYEHGVKYKLDQGYGGSFSHRDENFYALDFAMDTGTNVVAARDGVVIEVKEDSNRGGASQAFATYGNYISVYHLDGTFASYVHLKQNGALVSVGDIVKQGDIIGLSGNTGLSTGPHLHFSVNIPTMTGSRQSIPIKLIDLNGVPVLPVSGNYYYSTHPGKPEFPVLFGSDIVDEDYDNYSVQISKTSKLEFRDESVDNTTIIFCRNGYDKSVEGEIKFSFKNSYMMWENPIPVAIPPLTEIFVTVVKPKDISKPTSFSYNISYRVIE